MQAICFECGMMVGIVIGCLLTILGATLAERTYNKREADSACFDKWNERWGKWNELDRP